MEQIEKLFIHFRRWRSVLFLIFCLFQWPKVISQGGRLLTPTCETVEGSKINVFWNYASLPGDPASWIRPNLDAVVDCQPNVTCVTLFSGYTVSQNNAGLEYTLTIHDAKDVDFGLWTVDDGKMVLSVTIPKAVDLSKIQYNCSSGTQTGENIRIEANSTDRLTCGTECISENITTSCYLEHNGNKTRFASSTSSPCGNGLQMVSSTVGLSNLSGDFNVCCDLTAGDCSYNQTNCKTLAIVGTDSDCCDDHDCRVSRNGAIAVLVLASILLVAYVGFIVSLLQAEQSGKWPHVVVALIDCACDVTAIILKGVSLSNGVRECVTDAHIREEQSCGSQIHACEVNTCEPGVHVDVCGMRTAGVVLFVVALLVFIPSVVFHLKNRGGT